MSDQCKNCTLRGDLKLCQITECTQHESWMVVELNKQLKASKAELGSLKKALGESINYRECNLNYTQALDALCKAGLFYNN